MTDIVARLRTVKVSESRHAGFAYEGWAQEAADRIEKLEAALREIAAIGYGLEATDTDAEMYEYWWKTATRYREIARKALRKDEPK